MPQVSDQTVQNASGAAVRVDINGLMGALFSSSSGAAAPTPTVAGMLWFDTTNGILNVRNAANTLWVAVLNASSNLSDLANIATARTNLGGTAAGIAIWMAANVAAQRSALGLVIGTDVLAFALAAPKDSPTFTTSIIVPNRTAGDNTTQAANTAFVTAADAVSTNARIAADAGFTSGNQTLTSGGLLTIAHGLGRIPYQIEFKLKNLVSEHGWAVGDTLFMDISGNSAGDNRPHSVYADAVNIYIRLGITANAFVIGVKSTGADTSITNASWALIVRAF